MERIQNRFEWWWKIDDKDLPTVQRSAIRLFKRLYIAIDNFISNNLGIYASALTYNTALAAVPVLAISFAIARGFGFDDMIEGKIRESLNQLSPEMTNTVMAFVESYLEHTKSGVFVGVGLLLLFYTLVNLTMNIETAFNTIWQVSNTRNVYRQITDYISVFFILPLFMIIASGISVYLISLQSLLGDYIILGSTLKVIIAITPFLITIMAFTLLYKLMPNTRVNWSACIAPGIIAGVLFQGLEYFYIHYQIKISAYNAIYGSFAAIPLLLLFLQFTWYICLIGCQLCYANQSVSEYAFERSTRTMSRRFRDSIALLLVSVIAKRFAEGKAPLSRLALSRATHLPEELVGLLLGELVSSSILAVTHNDKGTEMLYLPAIDIHRLTVRAVIQKIESHGTDSTSQEWINLNPEWQRLRDLRYHDNQDALVAEI